MTDPITLSGNDARELVYNDVGEAFDGWTVVAITDEGDGRWMSYHRLVIRDEQGRHFAARFERGLTEHQDTHPFEYEEEVEFRPVFPDVRMVEVTDWSDKPPAPGAEPTSRLREALTTAREALDLGRGCPDYSDHGPSEEWHCEGCLEAKAVEEAIAAIDAALADTPAELTEAQPDTPPAMILADSDGELCLVCRRCHRRLKSIADETGLDALVAAARLHECPEPADTPEDPR